MQHENVMLFPQKSRISTNTQQSHTHIIKIWEEIGEPMEWSDEIDVINSASEMDTVVLDICSPGGVLDTGILFHRALMSTPAHTVAVIGPDCSSCASVIALSCREFVLDATSQMMLHTSSYALRGKDVDIFEHSNFSRKQLRKIFEDIYLGAVSEQELEDIIKGTPLYFDAEQLAERLDKLTEYRQNQPCNCGDPECGESEQGEEPVDFLTLMEERMEVGIAKGVEKALKKLEAKEKKAAKPSTKTKSALDEAKQPHATGYIPDKPLPLQPPTVEYVGKKS